MSALLKQRAAVNFCRTHPGKAFDEGMYDELLRWKITQEPAEPEYVVYILENLWERGREELRLLGVTTVSEAFIRMMDFIRGGTNSGVLCGPEGKPIIVTGMFREDTGQMVTWFQATEEFTKYVEPITRLMMHEIECYGGDISVYSVCVHPQTERWFKLMGFLPDGWTEKLPSGATMRRFTKAAVEIECSVC